MRMVLKFGGSSLATPQRVHHAASLAAALAKKGAQVAVVVSAQGDTTDTMIAKAKALVPCPDCRGSRYSRETERVKRENKAGQAHSLPELMAMDIKQALAACDDLKTVRSRLQTLQELGLGYLTLGEATPSLSGGEAQRLKLASEMGKQQSASVFVFDEPTIGLHPLDVQTLLRVFDRLVDSGATVIVIEHDLDVIRNADYIIDMGPGGGEMGGRIVAAGTPEQIAAKEESITGRYLKRDFLVEKLW